MWHFTCTVLRCGEVTLENGDMIYSAAHMEMKIKTKLPNFPQNLTWKTAVLQKTNKQKMPLDFAISYLASLAGIYLLKTTSVMLLCLQLLKPVHSFLLNVNRSFPALNAFFVGVWGITDTINNIFWMVLKLLAVLSILLYLH